MKTGRGSGGKTHSFLTCVLDGGEWSGSGPGRFAPTERALFYQFKMRLDGLPGDDKYLLPLPGFKPWIVDPVASSLYQLRYPCLVS